MRNVVTSSDASAEEAGVAAIQAGGNAADAVVAAMLAGATRASSSALLGSGVVLIAGTGVGASFVDGRARAPGSRGKRPTAPEDPPRAWSAAVPALLDGALVAQNRFGVLTVGTVARAAADAVGKSALDAGTRARIALLEALPSAGPAVLERLGIRHAILEQAGAVANGLFTREDLSPFPTPVLALDEHSVDGHQILTAPLDPVARFAPPPPPSVPIGGAACADMHGAIAIAIWAVPDEAVALANDTGLGLAALATAPRKHVTRAKPGTPLAIPIAGAILRSDARAWSAVIATGDGDLVGARDRAIASRLASAGISFESTMPGAMRGAVSWVVRDLSGEARATTEARET